jgi:phosphosulfolactate synthase (CoM biosynthesis protein A)
MSALTASVEDQIADWTCQLEARQKEAASKDKALAQLKKEMDEGLAAMAEVAAQSASNAGTTLSLRVTSQDHVARVREAMEVGNLALIIRIIIIMLMPALMIVLHI